MGLLRERLKQGGTYRVGGSGRKRTPFHKWVNGVNTIRIFFFEEDGEDSPYFKWYNHQLSRTESVACRKTFDPDEHCDMCEQVRLLWDTKDKSLEKEAGQKSAKPVYWFVIADLSDQEPQYMWRQLPFGAAMRVFQNIALKNGWTEDEPDFESDEFLDCLEKGLNKYCGPKGHDISITFNANSTDPKKYYGKVSISTRPGKKIEIEGDVPDPIDAWKAINRWDQAEETEADAPPLEDLERGDLEAYAKQLGVKFNKRMKDATIIKKIREVEGSEDE